MIKEYWLKNENIVVAEITYDEDADLFSMNVLEPKLFFDRLDKLFFTDIMFRRWFDSRLWPEYQGGYFDKVKSLGFIGSEPNLRWEMFKDIRGINIKDRNWLAFREDESYEEFSPWYKITHPELYPNAIEVIE